jgi:hypothetical protein
LGFDALVEWGKSSNLRIFNTRKKAIKIDAKANNGKLTVSILGKREENEAKFSLEFNILAEYEPTTMYEVDTSLKPGEQKVIQAPVKGYEVETYKVYRDSNNKPIKKETLSRDKYEAKNKIIAVSDPLILITPTPKPVATPILTPIASPSPTLAPTPSPLAIVSHPNSFNAGEVVKVVLNRAPKASENVMVFYQFNDKGASLQIQGTTIEQNVIMIPYVRLIAAYNQSKSNSGALQDNKGIFTIRIEVQRGAVTNVLKVFPVKKNAPTTAIPSPTSLPQPSKPGKVAIIDIINGVTEPQDSDELVFDSKTLSIDLGKNWEKYTAYSYNGYVPSQRYLAYNSSSSKYSSDYKRTDGLGLSDGRASCEFEHMVRDFSVETITLTAYSNSGNKSISFKNPFVIKTTGATDMEYNFLNTGSKISVSFETINALKSVEYYWRDNNSIINNFPTDKAVNKSSIETVVPDFGNKDYAELIVKITDIYGNRKELSYWVINKKVADLDYEVYAVTSVGVDSLHDESYTGQNTYYISLVNPNNIVERLTLAPDVKIPDELKKSNVINNKQPIFVAVGLDKDNKVGNIVILNEWHGTISGMMPDGESWILLNGKFFKGYNYILNYDLKDGQLLNGSHAWAEGLDYYSQFIIITSKPYFGDGNGALSSFITGRSLSRDFINNLSGKIIGLEDGQHVLHLFVALDK